MAGFVTESLKRELTPAEVSDIKRRRRAGEFGPVQGYFQGLAFSAVFFAVLVIVIGFVIRPLMMGGTLHMPGPRLFLWAWLFMLAVVVIQLVRAGVNAFRTRGQWLKLARFASDNNLQFRGRSASPAYPGLLFDEGSSRASLEHIYSPNGPFADAGAYRFTTGSGDNQTTHLWQFAAFRLPAPMPHLLLDSKANNRGHRTNLPASFVAKQRLSLGSPFDDRFELYAPEGYSQDAFYLFPPHVLEQLLETPANYDIEIVDNWMFLYTQSGQDLTKADTWENFDRITDLITSRIAPVADRYRDRRAVEANPRPLSPTTGDPGRPEIAEQGRRLRQKTSWIYVVLLFIFMYFFGSFLLGFIQTLIR